MRKRFSLILISGMIILLTACKSGVQTGTSSPEPVDEALPSAETPPGDVTSSGDTASSDNTDSSDNSASSEDAISSGEAVPPSSKEEIKARFTEVMTDCRSDVSVDISGIEWEWGAEIGLRNIYYQVLADHPDLKYTYDILVSVSDDTAVCSFLYMPYKTGAYDKGVPAGAHIIDSLHAADVMAQSMINGTERLSVAITNPSLTVDDLQRALGQAGYGWIVLQMNREGTEITASSTPHPDILLADCVSSIRETFTLCQDILAEVITDGMTQRDKIAAAYTYVTQNTAYDFRYYSDRDRMPFESTVALGALRDGLAICGGYSHAFEMLLDMLGIENYTVSGTLNGEYHAWNYVVLDGMGYYCDPTTDRGGMDRHFLLTAEELAKLGGYDWDPSFYESLRQ